MKKLFSIVLAMLLFCLPVMALAEASAQEDAELTEEAEAAAEETEAEEEENEEEEIEEPVSPFFGEWVCDNASIYIDEDEGVYSVFIMWDTSDNGMSIWEYTCSLDSATGALTGTGSKTNETIDDEGETITSEVEYADGTATFTIDGDALIWADARDDIAQGMRFERSADDEVLEDGAEEVDEEAEESEG